MSESQRKKDTNMVLSGVTDGVGNAAGAITGLFRDPVIRLGVTGLSRAGKTVFITSLVANMLNRGRMPQLVAAATGDLKVAYLQPQPDDTVARFDYESHLDALLGSSPTWPQSTRTISELRLSLRVQPNGMLSGFSGPRTVHIDIVDYPGEWLLDLGLLDKSYDEWAAETLKAAATRAQAKEFLAALEACDPSAKFEDVVATKLAGAFASYLGQAREDGFSNCTPGRFLLPGDLAGSPVLTFAPMPAGDAPRKSLRAEMARRFEAYKSKVVRPFFRDHFAKLDRQVVLIDVLKALANGPAALADLEAAMTGILNAFRPGRSNFLAELFLGRRIDKILFAATKADHVHHTQHGALTELVQSLTRSAKDRADFRGADTMAMSLAALRSTVEADLANGGQTVAGVKGTALETGKTIGFFPGQLPISPAGLLSFARQGGDAWEDGAFGSQSFAPASLTLGPNEGPPHIRLDKALQFLIGDRL